MKDDLGRDVEALVALSRGSRAVFGSAPTREWHVPKAFIILLALAVVAGIAGGLILMSQTVPPVPAYGMTPSCATLTPSNQSRPIGSSGHLIFNCTGSSRAFHVDGVFASTPAFRLPANYTSLHIFPHTNPDADLCVNIDGQRTITGGMSLTFTGSGDWGYCAEYAGVTKDGLAAFTVTWST